MEETCINPAAHLFLEDILPDFEICARHAVERVLALPTFAPRNFKVSSSRAPVLPLGCFIECWNSDYSLILSVGMNKADLNGLLPAVSGEDLALDALGEVANVIAGRVLAIRRLEENFGRMAMSPPLFSNGGVATKKTCCIHGVLMAKSARMFLGLAIAPAGKEII